MSFAVGCGGKPGEPGSGIAALDQDFIEDGAFYCKDPSVLFKTPNPAQPIRCVLQCGTCVGCAWGGGSDCKCVVQDTQPCAAAEVCFVCVRSVWQCACWQHLPACCSRHPILSGAGFCVVSLLYSHRAAPAAEFKQVRQVFTPIQQEHATLKQHTHTHQVHHVPARPGRLLLEGAAAI